jgi:hypothetical protein
MKLCKTISQRTAWSEGMTEEVVRLSMNAVVGGDVRLVSEGAYHVKDDFGLRDKLVPEVDRERRVCSGLNVCMFVWPVPPC